MSLVRQYIGFVLIALSGLLLSLSTALAAERDEVIFFFNKVEEGGVSG